MQITEEATMTKKNINRTKMKNSGAKLFRNDYHFLIAFIFFISVNLSLAQEYQYPSLIEVNPPDGPESDVLRVITGGRLIDGLGGKVINDAVVIVAGNRILAAGPKNKVNIPESAEVTDARGMTILPGLIDAHLHTINDNSTLNTFLRNGVTTMRDPGHPFRFYQSISFAETALPRIFLTGAHLDGFPGVYIQQAVLIKNSDHIRKTIRDYVEKGGSGIKIYFRLPLKYYEVVLKTADFYNIPVVAHMELVDADEAIRAGLKGVEHVTSFGTSLAHPDDAREFRESVRRESSNRGEGRYKLWSKIDLKSDRVKEVLELSAKENVVLSPTLATFERQAGDRGVKDYHVAGFKNMVEFVGMANRAGVKIVTGSHTSSRYADRGWAYQREMELLVEAGLTPLEVITGSTIYNAFYFHSNERIGSIEPGKLANLIMVQGDPSVDITKMYEIQKVMLNGQWVDRTAEIN